MFYNCNEKSGRNLIGKCKNELILSYFSGKYFNRNRAYTS